MAITEWIYSGEHSLWYKDILYAGKRYTDGKDYYRFLIDVNDQQVELIIKPRFQDINTEFAKLMKERENKPT